MSDKSLVKNAADPEQVKEAEEKEKSGRDKELDDTYTVLASPQGRRFFYRYLVKCGIFETSFSENAHRTYFLEGQRNVGLALLSDMNETRPDAYAQMMKENTQQEEGKKDGRRSKAKH